VRGFWPLFGIAARPETAEHLPMRPLLFLPLFLAVSAGGAEFPVTPYVDPAQLECPWPKMSHYLQPWRGYLENRSGYDFLQGIGINLHLPANAEELGIRLLAESGFKAFRIEIGWGEMGWDETQLNTESRVRRRLELCARYGIRPTLLINAHQGVPCPTKFFERRLLTDAPKGSRIIHLDNLNELVIGRSGIKGLSDYWAAEGLVTAVDIGTGEITLSKPLPKELKAGRIAMATLKYAPLHPVNTPEFDETAAGWVGHALHLCRLAESAGLKDYDLEIWNELTFGTHFLNINDYYDQTAPKITAKQPDFLNAGGRCWELARRTTEAVKRAYPRVRIIWGFSNTTFYHCPIAQLPPGTDGQSYHPYGICTRVFKGVPERQDQPPLEGFVPAYEIRMVEGWAPTFIQTECLIRHLRPDVRLAVKAPGVDRFYHYLTEHGVLPPECGVRDDTGAWQLKALCATRSFCFWLNKGVDVLHYFDAYEDKPGSFGLLPVNLKQLSSSARLDDVATPPLRAIRNLTRAFADSVPLAQTDALRLEAVSLGPESKVFAGDAHHPPLWHRDLLALLPFQVNSQKQIVVAYVMTRDAVKPFAPEMFRLRFSGLKGTRVDVMDVLSGAAVPVPAKLVDAGSLEITLPISDQPALIIVQR
jgi:hypothetical protein